MKITGAIFVNDNGTSATSATSTITSINIDGSTIYMSYIDGSGNLKATKQFLTSAGVLLATGCTSVS